MNEGAGRPEKYTEDFVREETKKLLEELRQRKEFTWKGELFLDKPYSRQRYSEWARKFAYHEEISDTIKMIDELCETKLVVGGLKKELEKTVVIFALKNNHEWKDKQEVDNHLSGGVNFGWIDDNQDDEPDGSESNDQLQAEELPEAST